MRGGEIKGSAGRTYLHSGAEVCVVPACPPEGRPLGRSSTDHTPMPGDGAGHCSPQGTGRPGWVVVWEKAVTPRRGTDPYLAHEGAPGVSEALRGSRQVMMPWEQMPEGIS